jgi:hypothetical protein
MAVGAGFVGGSATAASGGGSGGGAGAMGSGAAVTSSAASSSTSSHFLSAARDGSIKFWDTQGACVRTLRGHRGQVTILSLPPAVDTANLASAATVASAVAGAAGSSPAAGQAASACVNRVLSCGSDGVVRLWDFTSGRCVRQFDGHRGAVTCLRWGWPGFAASAGVDGVVRVWNLLTGQCVVHLNTAARDALSVLDDDLALLSRVDDDVDVGDARRGDGDSDGVDGDDTSGGASSAAVVVDGPQRGAVQQPQRSVSPGGAAQQAQHQQHAAPPPLHPKMPPPSAAVAQLEWCGDWLVCANKQGVLRVCRWQLEFDADV